MPLNPNSKPFVPASRKVNESGIQDTLDAINSARTAYQFNVQDNAGKYVERMPALLHKARYENMNVTSAINEAVSLANTEASENAAIAEAVQIEGKSRKNRKNRKALRGGNVDNMVLQMPKVGYTQLPSDSMGGNAGILADGKTPFMLNVPYSTSPSSALACMKGGKAKKTKKTKKTTRKSRKSARKSRKSARKSRKSARKSRKSARKH